MGVQIDVENKYNHRKMQNCWNTDHITVIEVDCVTFVTLWFFFFFFYIGLSIIVSVRSNVRPFHLQNIIRQI